LRRVFALRLVVLGVFVGQRTIFPRTPAIGIAVRRGKIFAIRLADACRRRRPTLAMQLPPLKADIRGHAVGLGPLRLSERQTCDASRISE
jgi:hypothetical protein